MLPPSGNPIPPAVTSCGSRRPQRRAETDGYHQINQQWTDFVDKRSQIDTIAITIVDPAAAATRVNSWSPLR
jgi:hypothetical protein